MMNNQEECLKFIETSFRLLEQAKNAIARPSSLHPTTAAITLSQAFFSRTSSTPTRTATAANINESTSRSVEVPTGNSATPTSGAAESISHTLSISDIANLKFKKQIPWTLQINEWIIQSYLPNISKRTSSSISNRQSSRYSGHVLNTWAHDFICLSQIQKITPTSAELDVLRKAGLGKKKMVFKDKKGGHEHLKETLEGYFQGKILIVESDSWFRLKTQQIAFQLAHASSGGCGLKDLVVINCPTYGYRIQEFKEDVKSSVVYILAFIQLIDVTPISVNKISFQEPPPDGILSACVVCGIKAPLWEFQEHREMCHSKNGNFALFLMVILVIIIIYVTVVYI